MVEENGGLAHPGPLDGEIRRLTSLRDHLYSTADDIDSLRLESWQGTASEHFGAFHGRLTRRWREIGDLCDDAVRALEHYRDTLVEARHRLDSPNDLHTTWQELDPAAQATARRFRVLNTKLLTLRSLFEAHPHPPATPDPPEPPPPPRPAQPPVDFRLTEPGHADYSRQVRDLAHEFLDAHFAD